MSFCGKCGARLAEESIFCSTCGHRAAAAVQLPPGSQAITDAPNRSSPFLRGLLVAGGVAIVLFVALLYSGRQNDPVDIVKKHFAFYSDYSHGDWQQASGKLCGDVFETGTSRFECWEVTYTIPVEGCGLVRFNWLVDPSKNTFWYRGTKPRIYEAKYPLYAFYSEDSHTLNNSLALGKPLPQTCQYDPLSGNTAKPPQQLPPRLEGAANVAVDLVRSHIHPTQYLMSLSPSFDQSEWWPVNNESLCEGCWYVTYHVRVLDNGSGSVDFVNPSWQVNVKARTVRIAQKYNGNEPVPDDGSTSKFFTIVD